jgi:hypothetical protein
MCERSIIAAFRDARVVCQSREGLFYLSCREGAFIFHDKCTVGYYTKKIEMFSNDPSICVVARRLKNTQIVIHSNTFDDTVC